MKKNKKTGEMAEKSFVHQNQIGLLVLSYCAPPPCATEPVESGGICWAILPPPPLLGLPRFSNLPSALCKTFTYVNVFDIEMRLQLRLHAADCSVVCLKSQLSAIYTEFTYVICIIERRYFYDIART